MKATKFAGVVRHKTQFPGVRAKPMGATTAICRSANNKKRMQATTIKKTNKKLNSKDNDN